MGARDFDELGSFVEQWARKTVKSLFVSGCSTDLNADLYIFSMATWSATLAILKNESSFRKRFPSDNISAPRLLWDYNNNPLNKASLGEQVSKGAGMISGTVKSLEREVRELRSEMQSMQSQQADMMNHQTKMLEFMTNLDRRIGTTQQAFLIQGCEIQIHAQLSEMESQIGTLCVAALLATDLARKAEIEATMERLKGDIARKRAELADNTDRLVGVTGMGTMSHPATIANHAPAPTLVVVTSPPVETPLAPPSRPKKRKTMDTADCAKCMNQARAVSVRSNCSFSFLAVAVDTRIQPIRVTLNDAMHANSTINASRVYTGLGSVRRGDIRGGDA